MARWGAGSMLSMCGGRHRLALRPTAACCLRALGARAADPGSCGGTLLRRTHLQRLRCRARGGAPVNNRLHSGQLHLRECGQGVGKRGARAAE